MQVHACYGAARQAEVLRDELLHLLAADPDLRPSDITVLCPDVATFVPLLAVFFAALALLEDTGYFARAAYVMDRYMHRLGLHGKSFLPLCLGFGCNVPAVMGARVIDSPSGRLLTILLKPILPLTAARVEQEVFALGQRLTWQDLENPPIGRVAGFSHLMTRVDRAVIDQLIEANRSSLG